MYVDRGTVSTSVDLRRKSGLKQLASQVSCRQLPPSSAVVCRMRGRGSLHTSRIIYKLRMITYVCSDFCD